MFDEKFLDELAGRVAGRVLDRLFSDDVAGLIDQAKSPLGRRTHIRIARQIGRQVGRRYFLTREQVDAAMADERTKARPKPRGASAEADVDGAMGAIAAK